MKLRLESSATASHQNGGSASKCGQVRSPGIEALQSLICRCGWVKGKTLTRHGVVAASWTRDGNRALFNFKAPPESSARYVTNPSLAGLEIAVNHEINL